MSTPTDVRTRTSPAAAAWVSRWRSDRNPARFAASLHVLSLVAAAAVVLWLMRRGWFFYDEWEFITNRLSSGDLQLFVPHNEHWSTLPLLIYRILYGAVGLTSYLPYMAVLMALHVAAAHLLWRALRRAGVDPWLSAALPAVFLFLGAGPENVLWAFGISFVGSVVFGLLQALLADHGGRLGSRDVASWAAGVLALMSSGIGLTFLSVATLIGLMRRGLRGAVVTASVPFLVYVVWFLAVGRKGVPKGEFSFDHVLALPRYVWSGLTATADQATGLAGGGAVIIIGLALWLVRRAELARVQALPFATALGAVVLFTLIGSARLGLTTDIAGRYIYVATALLIPAAGMGLQALVQGRALRRAVAVALVLAAGFNGAGVLRSQAHDWSDRDVWSEQRILAAADLLRSGAPVVGATPEPIWAPDITTAKLRRLIVAGVFPAGVSISDDARMYAIAQLQIAGGTDAPPGAPSAAVVIRAVSDVAVSLHADGRCIDLTPAGAHPQIGLGFTQPGLFTLTSATPDTLHVALTSASGTQPGTAERSFPVAAGSALPLDVTWSDAAVVLRLPVDGRDTLCAASIRSGG